MYKRHVLVLDFDGVIADTLNTTLKNLNAASRSAGLNYDFTKEEFLTLSEGNFFESIEKKGITKDEFLNIDKIWKTLMKGDLSTMSPFSGMKELIKNMKNYYQMYIVTSNFKELLQPFLEKNDVNHFTQILDADHDKNKYKKLNQLREKHKDSKIIFIADTKGDILEGKEAKVICVGVSWGYHSKEKLEDSKPDYLFHNISELESFLLLFKESL
jgi:phosphoglycolate phosphatase